MRWNRRAKKSSNRNTAHATEAIVNGPALSIAGWCISARNRFCHSAAHQSAPMMVARQISNRTPRLHCRQRPVTSGQPSERHSPRSSTPSPYPIAKHRPLSAPCISGARGTSVGVSDAATSSVPNTTPAPHKEEKKVFIHFCMAPITTQKRAEDDAPGAPLCTDSMTAPSDYSAMRLNAVKTSMGCARLSPA